MKGDNLANTDIFATLLSTNALYFTLSITANYNLVTGFHRRHSIVNDMTVGVPNAHEADSEANQNKKL
jgi:hypothetical protein